MDMLDTFLLSNIIEEVGENNDEKENLIWITYTYISGHYNPSVSIIDLVSHTTYVVCVNFIHKWRDLQA